MNASEKLTILASCPFCGCAAAYYGAAVRCTSFKCNAGLSPNWSTKAVRSVQGDPDERLRQAQAETAKRWNHRASQDAPAPQEAAVEKWQPTNYRLMSAIEAAAAAPSDALRAMMLRWCDERQSDVLGCIDLNASEEAAAIMWLNNFRAALSTPTEECQ